MWEREAESAAELVSGRLPPSLLLTQLRPCFPHEALPSRLSVSELCPAPNIDAAISEAWTAGKSLADFQDRLLPSSR